MDLFPVSSLVWDYLLSTPNIGRLGLPLVRLAIVHQLNQIPPSIIPAGNYIQSPVRCILDNHWRSHPPDGALEKVALVTWREWIWFVLEGINQIKERKYEFRCLDKESDIPTFYPSIYVLKSTSCMDMVGYMSEIFHLGLTSEGPLLSLMHEIGSRYHLPIPTISLISFILFSLH